MKDLTTQDFSPEPSDQLYHYCSADSLWAILQTRTLWMTSVYALNDSAELRWGRQLVAQALSEDTIEFRADFRFAVHAVFSDADKHTIPVVFSLSRSGDLLSQWRAYANDGLGFAISFNAQELQKQLPVNLKAVNYDPNEQHQQIGHSLKTFASMWRNDNTASRSAVLEVLPTFAMDLLCLKNPTFFEEREVRMVHLLLRRADGSLYDPGGHSLSVPNVLGAEVKERMAGGSSAPYIAMPFDAASLISGIALGPKNALSTDEVARRLAAMGLPGLPVNKSKSTYR